VPLTQAMTADIPGTMWLMPTARFTFSSASLGHSAHRQHSGYQGRQMWQSSVFSIDLYATMPFGHIVEHWYLHCVCSVLSPLLFARLQFVFTNNPLLPGLLILVSFCPLSHQLFVFRFSLFFFWFHFPFHLVQTAEKPKDFNAINSYSHHSIDKWPYVASDMVSSPSPRPIGGDASSHPPILPSDQAFWFLCSMPLSSMLLLLMPLLLQQSFNRICHAF